MIEVRRKKININIRWRKFLLNTKKSSTLSHLKFNFSKTTIDVLLLLQIKHAWALTQGDEQKTLKIALDQTNRHADNQADTEFINID